MKSPRRCFVRVADIFIDGGDGNEKNFFKKICDLVPKMQFSSLYISRGSAWQSPPSIVEKKDCRGGVLSTVAIFDDGGGKTFLETFAERRRHDIAAPMF